MSDSYAFVFMSSSLNNYNLVIHGSYGPDSNLLSSERKLEHEVEYQVNANTCYHHYISKDTGVFDSMSTFHFVKQNAPVSCLV